MNFDFGKTVSEMAEGRTKEELLEDSNLSFRQLGKTFLVIQNSVKWRENKEILSEGA